MDERDSTYTRRGVLRAGAGAAAGATALGATGTAGAQQDAYGGFLSEEGTWGGTTADASGTDEVTVAVGAQGNGGNFAFGPAALYIEPGTTITWEWTGAGGGHNVVNIDDESLFDSREETEESAPSSPETTYEFTFEEGDEGVYQYVCIPHRALEMKGVVVVGEDNVETDLVQFGEGGGDEGFGVAAAAGGIAAFGVVALLGVAAYRELVGDETA